MSHVWLIQHQSDTRLAHIRTYFDGVLTLRKIAIWLSKHCQKLDIQKNWQKLSFFQHWQFCWRNDIFCQFFFEKKIFLAIFFKCKFLAIFWHSNGNFPEGQDWMRNIKYDKSPEITKVYEPKKHQILRPLLTAARK